MAVHLVSRAGARRLVVGGCRVCVSHLPSRFGYIIVRENAKFEHLSCWRPRVQGSVLGCTVISPVRACTCSCIKPSKCLQITGRNYLVWVSAKVHFYIFAGPLN